MLIIPTSLSTAIVVTLPEPGVWSAISFLGLFLGGYCLWEMPMSALSGRTPTRSRWSLLAACAALLAAAAALFSVTFGIVSFNDGEVTTAWSFLLSNLSLWAFVAGVFTLVALRGIDASKAPALRSLPYLAWWSLGVAAMCACALYVAWAEVAGSDGATLPLALPLVLVVVAVGSLAGVGAVRRLRATEGVRAR